MYKQEQSSKGWTSSIPLCLGIFHLLWAFSGKKKVGFSSVFQFILLNHLRNLLNAGRKISWASSSLRVDLVLLHYSFLVRENPWPLNNSGLNCTGPLTRRFFLIMYIGTLFGDLGQCGKTFSLIYCKNTVLNTCNLKYVLMDYVISKASS